MWRKIFYIKHAVTGPQQRGCIFQEVIRGPIGTESLMLLHVASSCGHAITNHSRQVRLWQESHQASKWLIVCRNPSNTQTERNIKRTNINHYVWHTDKKKDTKIPSSIRSFRCQTMSTRLRDRVWRAFFHPWGSKDTFPNMCQCKRKPSWPILGPPS